MSTHTAAVLSGKASIERSLAPITAHLTRSQTGFTAIVDKALSAKYEKLVQDAPELIKVLPWGKDFEVDVFRKPDFTALEVLTFATGGIPAGINVSREICFVWAKLIRLSFLDPELLRDPRGSWVQERLFGCKCLFVKGSKDSHLNPLF